MCWWRRPKDTQEPTDPVVGVRYPLPRIVEPMHVEVNLTGRSVRALIETMELNDESKVEVINRAIQLYWYLSWIWRKGGDVFTRERPHKRRSRVQMEKLKVY